MGNPSINFEVLDRSMEELVLHTIKSRHRDYVYKRDIAQKVINLCKENKLSVIYKYRYDKYGELDYIEFIPVKFSRTPGKRKNNIQVDNAVIQADEKNWAWEDLSRFSKNRLGKIPK